MQTLELRPRGVGESLDLAFKLVRARFRQIATATAALLAVPFVLDLGVSTGSLSVGLSILSAIAGFVVTPILTAAVLIQYRGVAEGQDLSWRESIRRGRGHFWSIVGVSFLLGIGFFIVGFAGAIVPPLLIGIPFVAVFFSMVFPAIVFDGSSATTAIGRSAELVKRRYWASCGYLIVSAIILYVIVLVLMGVAFAAGVQSQGGNLFEDPEMALLALSNSGVLASMIVVEYLMSLITYPLIGALGAAWYLDLKVRFEGYDVERLAAQATSGPFIDGSDIGDIPDTSNPFGSDA